MPDPLDGAFISVSEKNGNTAVDRLEFTVQRDGVIPLLATWEYDGNAGDG